MNTADIGIMAHIDHGRTTTAERHMLQIGNVGLGTIAANSIGMGRLRVNDDEVKVWNDAFRPEPFEIRNYHKEPPPVFFDMPNIGPTGKPARNKAKTRAARKARKHNR